MQRQRKFHRRSRNGCQQCKQRHVRCDGGKPFCDNCVRSGGTCVYSDPFITVSGFASSEPQSLAPADAAGEGSSSSSVGYAAEDSTTGPPAHLPPDSFWLFESMTQRIGGGLPGLPYPASSKATKSFVIPTALSHPGLLHGALILEAVHKVWAGYPLENVKVALLHHKVEAFRIVSHQIQSPETATRDETVFSVVALSLLESAFWECSQGVPDCPLGTHMRGLERMIDTLPHPGSDVRKTLFQRVINMVVKGVRRCSIPEQFFQLGSHHIALMKMTGYPNADPNWWQGECTRAATEEYALQLGFTRVPDNMPLFIQRSRASFLLNYIYMVGIIRCHMVTPYMLHWLVENLAHDLQRSEADMIQGTWDRAVWFWTAMYGAIAVASAVHRSVEEEADVNAWRVAFDSKIRLCSKLMGIQDWPQALATLATINWQEDFDGQEEVRAIWEHAVVEPAHWP